MQETPRKFAQGDLVRLAGAGPVMIVKFRLEELLLCVWHDAAGRLHRGTFGSEELELVRAEDAAWLRVLERLSTRWPVVALF